MSKLAVVQKIQHSLTRRVVLSVQLTPLEKPLPKMLAL